MNKGINVLSLFDGMRCGRIALEKSNINVNTYYSSEIDKNSIKVADYNYSQDIPFKLGSVTEINFDELKSKGINLLIGGSPCQGFSVAGKKEGMVTKDKIEITSLEHYLELKKNNFEFSGQSYLFFEFVNALRTLNPDYWLLENVKVDKKWLPLMNEILGCQPIFINSNLVSAQSRPRYYWTNIPDVKLPDDKGILLRDIIDEDFNSDLLISSTKTVNRTYKKNYMQYDINNKGHGSQDQRAYYLDSKHGCLDTGANSKSKILLPDGRVRKTSQVEMERLQTVPEGYTSCVSKSQAGKMLGNGWNVDTIAHVLSHMPEYNKYINYRHSIG